MPSAISLDPDQTTAAFAAPQARIAVIAGPGSGKTEVVSARIASLLDQGLRSDDILVLSFSRAAVQAVRDRHRMAGSGQGLWVSTLDSLATRMLADAGVNVEHLGYDARIDRAIRALAGTECSEVVPPLMHVIVDEVQDVVGRRATFLNSLLAALPPDCGFTVLGDPAQGIYDFQLTAEEKQIQVSFANLATSLGAQRVELFGQYRAESRDAKRAMALRPAPGAALDLWWKELTDLINDQPDLTPDDLAAYCDHAKGRVAVLCRTNAAALAVNAGLQQAGVPSTLAPAAQERPLARWIAELLADGPASVTRDQFLATADDANLPMDPAEAWATLRRLTKGDSKYLTVRDLASHLSLGYRPASLEELNGRITVSTVHRAKGLEFDSVVLVDPDRWWNADDPEQSCRVAYVAITRSRSKLVRTALNRGANRWFPDERSGRIIRLSDKYRTTGFELRPVDLQGPTPPGRPQEQRRVQEFLRSCDSRPAPVTLTLNTYESTKELPVYDAMVEDIGVGTTTPDFATVYRRRVHPGTLGRVWPRITNAYLFGAQTVAGPPQDGPVGRNGLWLGPLIGGATTLRWSNDD